MQTKELTISQFKALQNSYKYFNKTLFNNQLPDVLLNLSRKGKAVGFMAPYRWREIENEEAKEEERMHEISINPVILSLGDIEIYSTLVHEMVHVQQYHEGTNKPNYHNKDFADKMQKVGLMPSSTGKPGGKITGRSMSDYPIEGGGFLKALDKMPKSCKLFLTSIESDYVKGIQIHTGSQGEGEQEETEGGKGKLEAVKQPSKRPQKNKVKFTCSCGNNIWGKPLTRAICVDCNKPYVTNESIPQNLLLNFLEKEHEAFIQAFLRYFIGYTEDNIREGLRLLENEGKIVIKGNGVNTQIVLKVPHQKAA